MDYVKRIYSMDFETIRKIKDFLLTENYVLVVNVETLYYGGYRLWYAVG